MDCPGEDGYRCVIEAVDAHEVGEDGEDGSFEVNENWDGEYAEVGDVFEDGEVAAVWDRSEEY